MAIRKTQRYDNLKATVMLGDQYAKDQTLDEYNYNQALLDEQFEQLGNVYTIEEELARGSKEYTPIRASIDTIKNISSSSLANDFKTLLFEKVDHNVFLGKRYKFGNNYWITTNISTIDVLMPGSLVQRCNNVLKWYDFDTDVIYEEPCIVGDKITATTVNEQLHIREIDGDLSVVLQYNDISNKIKENQRFILNGGAYTVRMVNKTKREETMNADSVGVIYLELDVSEINPHIDDLKNNIAYLVLEEEEQVLNGDIVTPNVGELFVFSPYNIQEYEVYNYVEGVKQTDTFDFEFYDALHTKYEVTNVTSNGFTIKCLDFSKVPLVVSYRNQTTSNISEFVIKLSGVL